ncbi:DNA repair protein XRCC4 [Brachionichthys hirsutus]|uniref:DNA repair protein XRCC4 n=1 Tax=Brachionichthys hirsutus TaxID=412623 RepID=UPI003604309F
MSTSTRQLHIASEGDSSYFLRVDWSGRGLDSGFQLLLTDGQGAWRGDVSAAAILGEAEELEMPTGRYVQDLLQALTQASPTYSFTLTPSPPGRGSSVTLTYEKVEKDLSFRLGSVLLDAVPQPAEAVRDLLVHSLQRGTALENHNHRLETENQRLKEEHQRIATELERYAGGKEALESELYSRFVLVLNEKKAKIRSLQESVTDLQESRSADAQQKEVSVKSNQRAGEEEEDEYGGSTDEEPEKTQSSPAPTLPSRESSTASPLDDSLKDIIDVAPSRKRRCRPLRPPDHVAKRPNPQSSQRKRTDPPAGSSKKPTPQRSANAAAATSSAEDLFEDF